MGDIIYLIYIYMIIKERSLVERKKEFRSIQKKHPHHIPIICKRGNKNIPKLEKNKFLIPKDLAVGQLVYTIRTRIELPPEKAIFILIGNTLPVMTEPLCNVYETFKNEDGFLYVIYIEESVYG